MPNTKNRRQRGVAATGAKDDTVETPDATITEMPNIPAETPNAETPNAETPNTPAETPNAETPNAKTSSGAFLVRYPTI